MDSGSLPTSSSEKLPHPIASLIGTVIALMTLTVPLVTILHYSSSTLMPPEGQSFGRLLSDLDLTKDRQDE